LAHRPGKEGIRHRVRLKIDAAGRVLIPADIRQAMGIDEGSVVLAWLERGELHLVGTKTAAAHAQELARELIPGRDSLADKLLAEVFSRLMEESLTVEQADAIVLRYGIDVVPFDEGLARRAGALRPATKSLSLADRACLALAQRVGLPVLTADRTWGQAGGRCGSEGYQVAATQSPTDSLFRRAPGGHPAWTGRPRWSGSTHKRWRCRRTFAAAALSALVAPVAATSPFARPPDL
jgi:AbrB family looped-hinge helix DNA binding protein